ncbi:C39 family peptidase [Lactobacillus taiwanensis]|uniref:C39 family peptidase n=1 Tax=Lactobacillus taiwanensis TaxID=508451 RepID=UPI0025A6270D|nr:C39 family peptidase [Lactobacillus taiwanensis]
MAKIGILWYHTLGIRIVKVGESNEKKHFKMFKKGKIWCYMGIVVLSTTLGLITSSRSIQADTSSTENTVNVGQQGAVNDAATTTLRTTDGDNVQVVQDTKDNIKQAANNNSAFVDISSVNPQASTSATQEGWQNENGNTYYYQDGTKLVGQQLLNGKNYYFNDQGVVQKNYFLTKDNHTYYYQNDGTRLDNGFYNNWGHTYYFGNDGARLDNGFYNNWGHTYYFGNDGARWDNRFYNNWGHTYYFGNDGARWDNRFMNNWGHMYYFGNDGALVTNQFVQHGGQTYYALSNGVLNAPRYFSQFTPIYAPEGCAVASLAMLLSIKNEYFNLADAYNNLPQYGGVYNTGAFRGIISPEALTNYAHKWDSNVRNITGSSLEDISRLVWAGHPVLYYGMSSFERAGQRNHAKVIVGENNGYFHIYDPCYWNQGQRAHTAGGNAYDWGADSWQSWGAIASEYIGKAITIY